MAGEPPVLTLATWKTPPHASHTALLSRARKTRTAPATLKALWRSPSAMAAAARRDAPREQQDERDHDGCADDEGGEGFFGDGAKVRLLLRWWGSLLPKTIAAVMTTMAKVMREQGHDGCGPRMPSSGLFFFGGRRRPGEGFATDLVAVTFSLVAKGGDVGSDCRANEK
jgi:hypothetical protein